jgi:hypothetical protein
LFDHVLLDDFANGARHFFDHRVRHLLANRVRHLGANLFANHRRARYLLADDVLTPHFAAAHLVRATIRYADTLRAAARLAGARIAGRFADLFPLGAALAGNANLLLDPLAALLANGLAGRDRLANVLDAVLIARLHAFLVAGLAHVLGDALGDVVADGAANRLVASLIARLADDLLAFLAMLLTDLLGDHVAVHLAMRFVHRFAHGVGALFPARLLNRPADLVTAFLPASLVARLANRIGAFFPGCRVARLRDGVRALFPARLVDRPEALLGYGFVAGLAASPVAGLTFVTIAGLADGLHDGFLNGLVTDPKPLLKHLVIDELVRYAALLLAGAEAALSVTAWLLAARIGRGAAALCGSVLRGPKQAQQRNRQRRRQAQSHISGLLMRHKFGFRAVGGHSMTLPG